LRKIHIDHKLSPANCAWIQGLAENRVKQLKQRLAMTFPENSSQFDFSLKWATFVINNSWHQSINDSPHVVLMGQPPLVNPDLLCLPPHPMSLDQKSLKHLMVRQSAKQSLHKYQVAQKRLADKSRASVEYFPGQKIWLFQRHLDRSRPRAYARLWKGPCTVIKKISDLIYLVKHTKYGSPFIDKTQVRMMEPFFRRPKRLILKI